MLIQKFEKMNIREWKELKTNTKMVDFNLDVSLIVQM